VAAILRRMTKTDAEAALMLALMAQWYQQNGHDLSPSWWNSPRQITAIAGKFNAPTASNNDPIAGLVQITLIYILFCAISRANQINSSALLCKSGKPPKSPETRAVPEFSGFFVFLSLCQMISAPTIAC
jgi:hypothetical protein